MISVIIPIYNSEKYLKNCLDSVISQSYQDLEIICINDASTDNSMEILQNFQKKDERIIVITLEKNNGLSYARNVGLDRASGEYILFVDSDDELEKNSIIYLLKGIRINNDIAACIGNIHVIYDTNLYLRENDQKHFKINFSGITELTDEIIDNFYVCVWGILYKRSEIERINIRFPDGLNYEDNYWHWCFFTSVLKINFIENYTYKYFRRSQSITSKTFKSCSITQSIDMLYIVEKIIEFWDNKNLLKLHEKYALKLLEQNFFMVMQYSQNYEKSYAAYQCAIILRKYNFDLSNYKLLNNIKEGNLSFIYTDTDDVRQYRKFLKAIKFIDKIFPINSFRRKFILFPVKLLRLLR